MALCLAVCRRSEDAGLETVSDKGASTGEREREYEDMGVEALSI